jgi:hypothetical protein
MLQRVKFVPKLAYLIEIYAKTIKTGSAWLSPMEIAFIALLLGKPSPARTSIPDSKETR